MNRTPPIPSGEDPSGRRSPPRGGTPRFPLRTLLLMIAALIAFARFYWVMHARNNPERPAPQRALPTQLIDVEPRARPDAGSSP